MKIKFIGTASGKTNPKRYCSSLFFESSKTNMLVDTGDGIQYALVKSGINVNKIRNILITHFHPDHFAGLPSLLIQMKLSKRKLPLTVFVNECLAETLKNVLNNFYLFSEKMSFEFSVFPLSEKKPHEINKTFSVTVMKNSHVIPEKYPVGYSVPYHSSSLLLQIKKSKIFYTSDIGSVNDIFHLTNLKPDFLISETTHISKQDLLKLFFVMNPGKMYLTHFDEEKIPGLKKWRKGLTPEIRNRIKFAEDGLII